MKLITYLNFPGTCEEALKFYQSVLGGEITAMMRHEGSPMEQTFWARRFGVLTDRFGIGWMVNCA